MTKKGCKQTPEQRAKMIESWRKRKESGWVSPLKGRTAWNKGKKCPRSPETIAKALATRKETADERATYIKARDDCYKIYEKYGDCWSILAMTHVMISIIGKNEAIRVIKEIANEDNIRKKQLKH